MLTGLVSASRAPCKEPSRPQGHGEAVGDLASPFAEFFQRHGAFLVLLFILLHKIGDTLGQIMLRLLLDDMGLHQ